MNAITTTTTTTTSTTITTTAAAAAAVVVVIVIVVVIIIIIIIIMTFRLSREMSSAVGQGGGGGGGGTRCADPRRYGMAVCTTLAFASRVMVGDELLTVSAKQTPPHGPSGKTSVSKAADLGSIPAFVVDIDPV